MSLRALKKMMKKSNNKMMKKHNNNSKKVMNSNNNNKIIIFSMKQLLLFHFNPKKLKIFLMKITIIMMIMIKKIYRKKAWIVNKNTLLSRNFTKNIKLEIV